MKIAVLGTGIVGETIGAKLISQGHEVMMGSRTAGNEKAKAWVAGAGTLAKEGSFKDAAIFAEDGIIFNCTKGIHTLDALAIAGAEALDGKILIDITNALDFSKGMPPTLTVCNDDSLAEQIQKAYPSLRVVKTLNTLNCKLMVNPLALADGEHDLFISGNSTEAKTKVTALLHTWGWKHIHDLGDISTARGTEMLLPIWIRLMGALGTAHFNFKIVK